jgi:predicted metalloprotease
MRWRDRRQSTNVQDRRSSTGSRMAIGGGLGGVVVLLIALFTGVDLGPLLGGGAGDGRAAYASSPEEETLREFVGVVLAETEDVWNELMPAYREPELVLFREGIESACGLAGSAVGPFYCPADQSVYLDLAFFAELSQRFGATGDFAAAYVIAHEVGHHVQNLVGRMDELHALEGRGGASAQNRLSVEIELEADFLAGVWAHHAARRGILEPGDVEEALNAASAIGDDRLQREAQGYVVPESFTHGTSAQRSSAFRRGLESGDPSAAGLATAGR